VPPKNEEDIALGSSEDDNADFCLLGMLIGSDEDVVVVVVAVVVAGPPPKDGGTNAAAADFMVLLFLWLFRCVVTLVQCYSLLLLLL